MVNLGHHLENLTNTHILSKSYPLSLVKTLAKGDKPLDVNMIIYNFGHICDNPPGKIPYYRLRPIHFGR
jgi:hypothetical protein